MIIKYLKNEVVQTLDANMANNLEYYLNCNSLVKDSDYITSSTSVPNIDLRMPDGKKKYDLDNTIIVYDSLKRLTPVQASDERLWIGLTHSEQGMKYTFERWAPTEKQKIGKFKSRYLFQSTPRNSYYILWLQGYLTYDESHPNPYKLTEYLLGNSDLTQGLLDRSYSHNSELAKNILRAIVKLVEEDGKKYPSSNEAKAFLKHINRLSGLVIVDNYSVDDLKEIIGKYLRDKNKPLF